LFSQLGPLFRTHLRQAEKTDTRLEVRRDDSKDHGKKHGHQAETEDSNALWEDSTSVSIEALRAFLVEFLKSRGNAVPEARNENSDNTLIPGLIPEYRPPASNRAAQAVKAYSSMAGQPFHAPSPETTEPSAPAESDLIDLLKRDDVRTMNALITELDALALKGVQTLTIEKADTFVESLVLAVRLEKSRN
jgi:hypothetical protein